ncbi:MAG TPA: Ig-like domain repeat protein, partial [Bryobacteraceae bacterium]
MLLVVAGRANAQNASGSIEQWRWSGELSLPRANACAALLSDGRILVAGGVSGGAPTAVTDMYDGSGRFTVAGSMLQPRENTACVTLTDGHVLVSGGNDAASSLRTTEMYDPATDSWSPGPVMAAPRAGHTATLTPWGAVLISGGDADGVVELIGLSGGRTVGTLPPAARGAAVLALSNRKIVIAGGSDSDGPTDGIWLYDVDSDAITFSGRMLMPRRAFAAAALQDGTVLFTGGYGADGNPLSTAEIFDPRTGTSTPAPGLSGPRAGHQAFTLPHNGQVLLVGGADAQGVLQSTERYVPWIGRFAPAAALLASQSGMAAALTRRGGLILAGGLTDSGTLGRAELYSFATIETDKDDYQPGNIVTFTGSGWRQGEQVYVEVTALPLDQHRIEFTGTAIADGSGEIRLSGFHIDVSHLGVNFIVTAAGMESIAQSRFSDGDTTSTTISLSPSSVQNFNQPLTITGHVQDTTTIAGNPVVVGSVTIRLDALVTLGTVPMDSAANYQLVVPASTIPPGVNHQIVASYSGEGREPSSSSPASYTVFAPTTISFTNPINGSGGAYGTGQTFTAQVLPGLGAPAVATGAVTFYDRLTNAPLSAAVAVDGTGSARFTANTLPVGNNHLRADYTPITTSGYQASSSYPTVDYTYVVSAAAATVNVTVLPVSPLVGGSAHLSASVQQTGTALPTGSVTFQDGLTTISGPIALINGQVADFAYVFPNAAIHPITAIYSGDSTYSGASSSVLNVNVGKANTAGAVDSSVSPSIAYGQAIQLTGHVSISPASFGSPTMIGGTAEFRDNGAPISGARDLGVGPGGAVQAAAGIPAVPFPPGDHQISLHYNGDANYSPSDSPVYLIHVNPATSTTTISSDVAAVSLGSAVTYKVTVNVTPSSAYSDNPPGSVTIYDSSGPTPLSAACSSQALTGGVQGVSTFSCTVTYNGVFPLNGGTHNITAAYTGDPSIGAGHPQISGSSSGAISVNVQVNLSPVDFSFSASANPSTFGQAITLGVTVAPHTGSGSPTGIVTFFDNGAAIGAAKPLNRGSAALTIGAGAGSDVVSPLAVGPHTITAQYGGDGNFAFTDSAQTPAPSTKSVLLTVNQGAVNVGVVAPSAGSQVYSTPVVLTAVVSPANAGAPVPTGNVQFWDGAVGPGSPLGNPVPLNASGSAQVTVSTLAVGTHIFYAQYLGSASYAGGNSPSAGNLAIAKADTTTSLDAPPAGIAGAPINLTAHVTLKAPATGFLSGAVNFYDYTLSTLIAAASINAAGVATVTLNLT